MGRTKKNRNSKRSTKQTTMTEEPMLSNTVIEDISEDELEDSGVNIMQMENQGKPDKTLGNNENENPQETSEQIQDKQTDVGNSSNEPTSQSQETDPNFFQKMQMLRNLMLIRAYNIQKENEAQIAILDMHSATTETPMEEKIKEPSDKDSDTISLNADTSIFEENNQKSRKQNKTPDESIATKSIKRNKESMPKTDEKMEGNTDT